MHEKDGPKQDSPSVKKTLPATKKETIPCRILHPAQSYIFSG